MSDYYTRDGRPTDDWSTAFPTGDFEKDKRVALTKESGFEISTVFLGLDHAWGGGRPLIFETMVFETGPLNNECERYSTEVEAVAGHVRMVEKCRAALRYRLADASLTGGQA